MLSVTERKVAAAPAHEGFVGSSEGRAHATRRGNGKLKTSSSAALLQLRGHPSPAIYPVET